MIHPVKALLQRLKSVSPDALIYKVLPHYLMEIIKTYFRVTVSGVENLPKRGAAIVAANHSGVSGFDAMVLHHEINLAVGRFPRVLTHHLWFVNPLTAIPAMRLGFIEANLKNGLKSLQKNQLVVIFPEGESGNFKPSVAAYQLQEFKRGFIRMALKAQVPIIPTLIIGAEESHINLKKLKLSKWMKGLTLPLPLNIIPLPSKWHIIFLEPIYLNYGPEAAEDSELIRELAEDFQERLQQKLNEALANRAHIFV